MKLSYVLITLLCFLLLALLLIIAARVEVSTENTLTVEPAIYNVVGACCEENDSSEHSPEPTYEMYFTEQDIIVVAKTLWGEARGCSLLNQQQVVWCVLNRVDDPRFPDTIQGVVTQPWQFHGYSADYPVTNELYAVALDVLTRWSMEKQGASVERELPISYLWFYGDGVQNWFREVY